MPYSVPSKRFYYLDVIKILCLAFVFLFHCFKIFDADWWYIKNNTSISIKSGLVFELGLAVMPGFFVISGASVWFSMQKRSGRMILQNIFKRFFFPLLFGLTVLAIPQIYFEMLSKKTFSGSIIEFIPVYINRFQSDGGFFWAVHLWFMVLLFMFSVIMLPFFSMGKKYLLHKQVQRVVQNPLLLLLFALLVTLPGWKLHPNGPLGTQWAGWNMFQNLMFFAFGFVLFSSTKFTEYCKKYKWLLLAVAIPLTAVLMYWYRDVKDIPFRSAEYNMKLLVRAIACWAWVTGVLGVAVQYFSSENRLIKYWTVAAMPFYILSQPVIIIVGYYVVQWPLSIFSKYCLVTSASFVLTICIYEVIKRNSWLRWMFGVPAKSSVKQIKQKFIRKKPVQALVADKNKSASLNLPAE